MGSQLVVEARDNPVVRLQHLNRAAGVARFIPIQQATAPQSSQQSRCANPEDRDPSPMVPRHRSLHLPLLPRNSFSGLAEDKKPLDYRYVGDPTTALAGRTRATAQADS
jgi:hypothetical protein